MTDDFVKRALAAGDPLGLSDHIDELAAVPIDTLEELAPKLEAREPYVALSFIKKREAEGESPEDLLRALAVVESLGRPPDEDERPHAEHLADTARYVGGLYLKADRPVPAEVFDHLSEHTRSLKPWLPLFATLDPTTAASVFEAAGDRILTQLRPDIAPLRALAYGDRGIREAIDEFVEAPRKTLPRSESVAALGRMGPDAIEPLAETIDALTAELDPDPKGPGYDQRLTIVALRNALLVALGERAAEGEAIDPRFDAYAKPEPEALFTGHGDFAHTFFDNLRTADALFGNLPEERVRAFIAAWHATEVRKIEQRLRRGLPNKCKKYLKKR